MIGAAVIGLALFLTAIVVVFVFVSMVPIAGLQTGYIDYGADCVVGNECHCEVVPGETDSCGKQGKYPGCVEETCAWKYDSSEEFQDIQGTIESKRVMVGTNLLSEEFISDDNDFSAIEVIDGEMYFREGQSVLSHVHPRDLPIDGELEHLGNAYYRDQSRIFYTTIGGSLQSYSEGEVDYSTFEPIGGGYAKDKDAVYWGEYKSTNVDLKTFRPIGSSFAVDKDAVYSVLNIIPEATPDDFMLLNGWYGKSTKQVYFFFGGVQVVDGVDPHTFDVLESERFPNNDEIYGLGKDKQHVVLWGEIVPGADVEKCSKETIEFCPGSDN